jgi:hypothetical protein
MNNMAGEGIKLWDETDGFYYDVLRTRDDRSIRFRLRSLIRGRTCRQRTVMTGQWAVRTTRSATLPRNKCDTPVRPCVPMTIRSACASRA